MKKVLISAIAVLMAAGAANATLIGLQWTTPGVESLPTAPNTPITVQFYMDAASGVTVQGIGLAIRAWSDAAASVPVPNELFQVSTSTTIPGWSAGAANDNSALNGNQFAAVNGPNYVLPAGKQVLVNVQIQYTTPQPVGTKFYLTLPRAASSIFDPAGTDMMNDDARWDSRYAGAYASSWAFGDWGNDGWSKLVKPGPVQVGQLGKNPLILNTPEPASLALLALGGLAMLRRR